VLFSDSKLRCELHIFSLKITSRNLVCCKFFLLAGVTISVLFLARYNFIQITLPQSELSVGDDLSAACPLYAIDSMRLGVLLISLLASQCQSSPIYQLDPSIVRVGSILFGRVSIPLELRWRDLACGQFNFCADVVATCLFVGTILSSMILIVRFDWLESIDSDRAPGLILILKLCVFLLTDLSLCLPMPLSFELKQCCMYKKARRRIRTITPPQEQF